MAVDPKSQLARAAGNATPHRSGWIRGRPWSLTARIVGILLLTQAALLPALFISLDRIAWRSNSELFASMAQGYLARHAAELSRIAIAGNDARLNAFVERVVGSGFATYAEVRLPDHSVRSHPSTPTGLPREGAMDSIEPGDDRIYYLSQPWRSETTSGTLLLGFDESFMHSRVNAARWLLTWSLLGFFVLVLFAGLVLARQLTEPLARLRAVTHQVATGNLSEALETHTGIFEVDELSRDLERMRRSRDQIAARMHQRQRLETVGTLAGGVSHEFNNILLPIILFLESALDTLAADHPARPSVARALGAAGRARDIVAKLLVFSRQDAAPATKSIHLDSSVDEALRLFSGICPSHITVKPKIDTRTDPVRADGGQVVQIVMNLCTNAYRAMPTSGGTITVALHNAVVDGEPVVELVVEDDGVGMDPATLSRIFEPFYTTREIGQGSGLGLAVVHGIVTNLRGTIVAESAPGQGTAIRVRLPSALEEES